MSLFDYFKKKICRSYGYIMVNEELPIFHDYARTTNKTIYKLEKLLEQNKAVFSTTYSQTTSVYNELDFITQKNIPIRIYDFAFKKGEFDVSFQKKGYRVGDIYRFWGLGYLGNIESRGIVKLVTDQYVVFDGGSNIFLYTYKELERLNKKKYD